jgi:hypothetical protein
LSIEIFLANMQKKRLTLARVVDLACKCGFSQQEHFYYTLRAYKPLSTTGNVHPHPLTSSLLSAEFALLVLRVYYSARGEIGVPAVRFARK